MEKNNFKNWLVDLLTAQLKTEQDTKILYEYTLILNNTPWYAKISRTQRNLIYHKVYSRIKEQYDQLISLKVSELQQIFNSGKKE